MDEDTIVTITFSCGHQGPAMWRCNAYAERYCSECAKQLPRPSECLRQYQQEHCDLGAWLGPIGAVINVRQKQGHKGFLAWSDTEAMFDALEGFEHTRELQPYIELFEGKGI